ncbi:hypothetical protein PAXRUDRAFT_824589 [Paxillus rubicundulus Ve08.2h10]|uniref:Uncharacterized protein n=1 Tax=Paxillus rubicundulus Ve08.2h10 TaxID=930991 RepID=A0A0D0DHL6_9AGAM|nr:hypothetical protein PAXRUDRAFT_824589 [Paxillus rubicundulus Ve08.2h10]
MNATPAAAGNSLGSMGASVGTFRLDAHMIAPREPPALVCVEHPTPAWNRTQSLPVEG